MNQPSGQAGGASVTALPMITRRLVGQGGRMRNGMALGVGAFDGIRPMELLVARSSAHAPFVFCPDST